MRKGISVAEKRAMLEEAGEPWPVCECHGLEKVWAKDQRSLAGGTWCCRISVRQSQARYSASVNGRDVRAAASYRYERSERGKAARARYRASENRARAYRNYEARKRATDPVWVLLRSQKERERQAKKREEALRVAYPNA